MPWPPSPVLAYPGLTAARIPEDAASQQETPDSQGETEESVPAVSRLPGSHTQPLRQTSSAVLHIIFFSSDVIKEEEKSI